MEMLSIGKKDTKSQEEKDLIGFKISKHVL